MSLGMIKFCILLCLIVATVLIAVLVGWIGLYGVGESTTRFIRNCTDLAEAIGERGRETGWYRRKEKWLLRVGASFHLGSGISPFTLLFVKLLLGFAGFLAVSNISLVYGAIVMILLYFLPEILFGYLNRQDNKKLLPQLQLVYRGLEIQMRAGVHVTQALAECYSCVKEKRLKQALLDMTSDLVVHGDIYEALRNLQEKFDNRHIDSLCIVILQSMESGQAIDLLNDLGEQMKDMELILMNGKKENLDRSITFYQLGILAAVLGVVIYACVTEILISAVRL